VVERESVLTALDEGRGYIIPPNPKKKSKSYHQNPFARNRVTLSPSPSLILTKQVYRSCSVNVDMDLRANIITSYRVPNFGLPPNRHRLNLNLTASRAQYCIVSKLKHSSSEFPKKLRVLCFMRMPRFWFWAQIYQPGLPIPPWRTSVMNKLILIALYYRFSDARLQHLSVPSPL
jgi:hypothetical protein